MSTCVLLQGISLLEVKNQLMVQYMLDLTLILKCKVTGQSIQDHPAVWRMIENRTVRHWTGFLIRLY